MMLSGVVVIEDGMPMKVCPFLFLVFFFHISFSVIYKYMCVCVCVKVVMIVGAVDMKLCFTMRGTACCLTSM